LDVVRAQPDRLRVVALGANRNADVLHDLAMEFPTARTALGPDALVTLATEPDADVILVATPGVAALRATVAALEEGKRVALANKEVLVAAGHLIRRLSGGAGDRLRPVDSEHNGLWQCLVGEDLSTVSRVALTASGGAFRDVPLEALPGVTPQHALRHPTWRMGPKVTIDSATLVNKGYEVVETHWLYGFDYEQIDVVYHPESVVHAMVEYVDGSVKALLAEARSSALAREGHGSRISTRSSRSTPRCARPSSLRWPPDGRAHRILRAEPARDPALPRHVHRDHRGARVRALHHGAPARHARARVRLRLSAAHRRDPPWRDRLQHQRHPVRRLRPDPRAGRFLDRAARRRR